MGVIRRRWQLFLDESIGESHGGVFMVDVIGESVGQG